MLRITGVCVCVCVSVYAIVYVRVVCLYGRVGWRIIVQLISFLWEDTDKLVSTHARGRAWWWYLCMFAKYNRSSCHDRPLYQLRLCVCLYLHEGCMYNTASFWYVRKSCSQCPREVCLYLAGPGCDTDVDKARLSASLFWSAVRLRECTIQSFRTCGCPEWWLHTLCVC